MSPNLALFIIRIVLALLLYAFVGGIVYLLWRDLRRAATEAKAREGLRGRLITIASALPSPTIGEAFPLLPVTSLGRAPTNTITLEDDTASLEHALISLRAGKWWLEDLGSRNGTLLNGMLVTSPTVISGGDLIGLGQAQFKLEFG
jgi:pSer/pThr/pTyr-binding forkhead associated (FHA) protein